MSKRDERRARREALEKSLEIRMIGVYKAALEKASDKEATSRHLCAITALQDEIGVIERETIPQEREHIRTALRKAEAAAMVMISEDCEL